jgi:N-methylhydantoinase A
MAIAIGIDIGGTFTDVVALDLTTGEITSAKALTSYNAEARAVEAGLDQLGIGRGDIERLVHGTTIGTNAILERRGVKTALLATQGFRDLLEIGRTRRMTPNTLFDLTFQRREPLVPRKLRFDISERLLSTGEVYRELDHDQLSDAIEHLLKEGVGAVAVCCMHAYANPAHEIAIRDALAARMPDVPVSLSHEIVPEYREFERMSTTVLNAYIAPLLDDYLGRLADQLHDSGVNGSLYMMASSGGVMSLERAKRFPVLTVLSGPAGGVVAAIRAGEAAGERNIITCDMGGTSTDVSMVQNLTPRLAKDNVIAGMPIKVPQIDINTVGAGGGSVAFVASDGQLHVGPRSAGSRPGPICYGMGGAEITITDANLALGRLTLGQKLGGQIAPQAEKVLPALTELAKRLGVDGVERMAEGIVRIGVAKMVSSIREISVARGHDPRTCVLVAFGGAGPMHAIPVAEALSIPRVIIPPFAGSLSALGLVSSDLRIDLSETVLTANDLGAVPQLEAVCRRLEDTARKRFTVDGFDGSSVVTRRSFEMRYRGQAYELAIPLEGAIDPVRLSTLFNAAYAEAYGHANENDPIEIVTIQVAGIIAVPSPKLNAVTAGGEALIARRSVWFSDRHMLTPVLLRERIAPGHVIPGPAIIEEGGATTIVFPGWRVKRDASDNLVMERMT